MFMEILPMSIEHTIFGEKNSIEKSIKHKRLYEVNTANIYKITELANDLLKGNYTIKTKVEV